MAVMQRPALTMPVGPLVSGKTRRRWLHRLVYLAIVLVVLAGYGLGAGAWYYSGQLVDVSPSGPHYAIKVLALHGHTVQLASTDSTRRNGIFGLDWPGGRVVLGPIVSVKSDSVARQIIGSTDGLKAGMMVDFDVSPYVSPADLHLRSQTVLVPGSLGRSPAWLIPGPRSTWVVLVHGWRANRADVLKAVPPLVRLGFPVLDITYRNDVGAPASSDHLYHLGATEWQDVQAAVRYALSHGARDVILYGYSMGGNMVESFLHHSTDAGHVRAVVLDSPALNWSAVIDWHGEQSSLLGMVKALEVPLIKHVIAWRIGLWNLDGVNQLKAAGSLKAPTLVFHGTGDTNVPASISAGLARARPDLVTFYAVRGAEHTQSWNVNPAQYESRLTAFLARVLG